MRVPCQTGSAAWDGRGRAVAFRSHRAEPPIPAQHGHQRRVTRVDLALGTGTACGLGGRDPVLQLQAPVGPITCTVGSPPSPIWRRRVLMHCGPAFGLNEEPSTGSAQNRVLLDGLTLPGLEGTVEPDGLLQLRLRQDFDPSGGGVQRIERETRLRRVL